ncbi:peptidoglycan editing factor PgeF [Lichenicola sp.]|uniref:peptidoglycan editing factor PgeF n=1 Tax=Lichenicola sp. TaxID=2804529 RepID=UPI003AFF749D
MNAGGDIATDTPVFLESAVLAGIRHGFFTRVGGVSEGPYASLNCSVTSGDSPDALQENRRRIATVMGVAPAHLLGITQVHGIEVATVDVPWRTGEGPRADAMVTDRPGLALGIITADCGPVLLADPIRGVIGAAHAGWRGAVAGVLDETVAAMLRLGAQADRILAAVGPCIGQASYEVGPEVRDQVLQGGVASEGFFLAGRGDRLQFDLAGYCVARLRASGVGTIDVLGCDTCADAARFFSHRRRVLAGGGPIGHQISVIARPIEGGAQA